ncbi:MAG: membrane protein insertase YidC [Verrucomicrobiales bacterium]
MDRKSIVILVVCLALMIFWGPLVNKIFPPTGLQGTNQVAGAASGSNLLNTNVSLSAANQGTNSTNNALVAATVTSNGIPSTVATPVEPPAQEKTVVLQNEDAAYTFSSIGGGIKLIELKKYPQVVGCKTDATNSAANAPASLNTSAPIPALTVISPESGINSSFNLTQTGNLVRAERTLANGLVMIKEFTPSTNYLVKATLRYENRGATPVQLGAREVVVGTATPMGTADETLSLGFEWYNGSSADKQTEAWFENRTLGCFPGSPRSVFEAGNSNVVWAAVHNQFFTMIALPEHPANRVIGRRIELPNYVMPVQANGNRSTHRAIGYQTSLEFHPVVIPPGQALQQNFMLFAGPKEYNTLAKLPQDMDLAMGFGRFFGFFAKALLLSMNAIASIGISYGVSIIIITIIIKLLFWPLTNASTRSMKRMGALQPQMKAIQEKYKEDPRKMQQKLGEFWKEHKINPMAGCIPILLQIPVFIGFYQMLQSAIELRGAKFLWACDLSQSDTVMYLAGFPINPLPILMGITMLWQANLTPPSPGMDPAQQKIMKYMPMVMVVFLYNFSAGLTLYWTVQNLLSILQMRLTKTKPEEGPGQPIPSPARPALPPRKKK